jgi:hypothetical protein
MPCLICLEENKDLFIYIYFLLSALFHSIFSLLFHSIFEAVSQYLLLLFQIIIGTIYRFFPGHVTVLLYSQLFSSFIPGRVTVQLYSRHFQLYTQPCYCTDLFPAMLLFSVIPGHFKPYSWPCNCTALFPAISSFIPGRVTVQIYSRPYSALFPLCRNASFFAVQQRLTIPGSLHNVRMQDRPEEQFSSRKTPRRHIIMRTRQNKLLTARGRGPRW